LHWAAASGYRIGHMYDELWHSVMSAPVPKNLKADGEAIYHEELAKLIKPLVRHAIRYWELTQMFIERTGIQTTWAQKIKTDLDRVRALLLAQPAGPGGLPGSATPAAEEQAPAGAPAAASSTAGAPARPSPAPPRVPARVAPRAPASDAPPDQGPPASR
jgi:hypothetical protein